MRYSRMLYAMLTVCLVNTLNAQTIPLDTAVHTGVLANGFTYYIRHNEEPKNRVFLYLVNKVGSVLEDEDQRGLAHFMEHMNFNGTTHYPKNELVNYLQKSGVRFGADLNAYTSFDETVYQLPLPADDASVLQNGFQIMRDWAQNATLDSVEIDKERGVVLEEERLGRGAGERMQRQYFPMILNQSRYAERLPIGKVDILNHFPASAIRRFHSDWYRPDLQALIVVGDIDVVKTEALVRQLFSDLKAPYNEKPRTKYTVPLEGQNHFLVVTDKEMPETDLQILIKHREDELVTETDYIHSMQRELFNEMVAERFAALQESADLPFISAGADISSLLGGLDAFTLNVTLKQGKFKDGFKAAWEVVEKIKKFGFTSTELQRAQQNYLTALETAFKERNKTSSSEMVGEYQRLFLRREASPGIRWEYQFVKDHVGQVTLEQINALVKEYIRDTNRDILLLAPEKDKSSLPDSATVSAWMESVSAEKLSAFADVVNQQPLLAVQLPLRKVVDTKTVKPLNITELEMDNGVRVILKPTDFKNDEILFSAFSPGGSSLYPDSDYQNAANAALVAGFGVSVFNSTQLNKLLAGKIVEVNPYIGERAEGIQGSAAPKDLETAFQLLYLRFTAPRKDTILFNNILNSSLELVANRYSDPKNVFTDTVNRVLGNYNYRRSPPSVEKLKQIDLEKIYRIYRERFSDASGFTFVFVGSFTIDSVRPLVQKYLGNLPSLHKKETARDMGIHIPPGKISKIVLAGTENKATVRMYFSGDYRYTPENNITLQAIKEILSIKITQHLREDESEVYSPSVQVSFNKFPKQRYSFSVSFGCAPANAAHLMESVEKEIATLRQNGPEAEDLVKFMAEYKRIHETQMTQNSYWLDYLINQYENQEEPTATLDYPERLEHVTAAMVKEGAQKWLDGKNEIRFELLPVAK